MTDRVHDHLTLGYRRGCVACAQTEADLACGKRELTSCKHPYVGGPVDLLDPPAWVCGLCGTEVEVPRWLLDTV